MTALKTDIREVPEARFQQGGSKSRRWGQTSLFQDVVKCVRILDIMAVCDSVQKSLDVSDWYGMIRPSRYSHLDGHPRLRLHTIPDRV